MGDLDEPTFRSPVGRLVGDDARAWLTELPHVEEQVARRWQLELGENLRGGPLASVRAARRVDGTEVVLKLAGPWSCTVDEITCLRLWAGGPAPRLLDVDESLGAILLERIRPGVRAVEADAEGVASLLGRLQVAGGARLRPLAETVTRRLDRAGREGRASGARLAWARTAVERLEDDVPVSVVVHGDFDERNLLVCSRRGLCAIDPLPRSGDGTYDAASWVHANRRPGRRARFDEILSAMELDQGRLRDWCGVIAVHG